MEFFCRTNWNVAECRMGGPDHPGDANDLVAPAVDTMRFDENGVFVEDLRRDLPAENFVAFPKDTLQVPFKQVRDVIGHSLRPSEKAADHLAARSRLPFDEDKPKLLRRASEASQDGILVHSDG